MKTRFRQWVHGKGCRRVFGHIEGARTKQWTITIRHCDCHERPIDESVVWCTQFPVLFDIEWIEVCMTTQTFVVRQIKQGMTLHIEHTVPPQNARYTDYVRMETFWTMESNRNHPSSCHHWFDRNNTLLLGHWISHTHPRSSSLQGEHSHCLTVQLYRCSRYV